MPQERIGERFHFNAPPAVQVGIGLLAQKPGLGFHYRIHMGICLCGCGQGGLFLTAGKEQSAQEQSRSCCSFLKISFQKHSGKNKGFKKVTFRSKRELTKNVSSQPTVLKNLFPTLLILLLATGLPARLCAQQPGSADKILVGAEIVNGDTLITYYLDQVEKTGQLPRRLVKAREKWDRLKYNVYKVYPYAAVAGQMLMGVDEKLEQIGDDRKARKAYLKQLEGQLNKRFKGELSDFTISQGQVLVKLISRQTGRPCFHLIKELKSGFSAVVFQSIALLFNNNLKHEYDATGDDRDIEAIVRELENDARYRYNSGQFNRTASRQ